MIRLLIGTTNAGKRLEVSGLLDGLPVTLVTPEALGLSLGIDETGETYAANASLKARTYARQSGLWVLADDTGLEVQALDGRPGLHSARLVPNGTDADRRARLLAELAGKPQPWPAVFRCVVAVAGPAEQLASAEGECPGRILPQPRGQAGFGYDPLFEVEGTGRTLAEMTLEEKNLVSHRGHAVRALRPTLEQLLRLADENS
jgi:XTP/dITP diphosphohydrolase